MAVAALTVQLILMALSAKFIYGTLEWPDECRNKYYCQKRPQSYPNETFIDSLIQQEVDIIESPDDRKGGGSINDIGLCEINFNNSFKPIFAIKDEYNVVWYVPQAKKFKINVELLECLKPGRVEAQESGLDSRSLSKKEVHCIEQRISFKFPVMSQKLDKIEERTISPKQGLPISCSAKVLKEH